MPPNHLLPLIQEVVQAFSLHYQEAMQPVLNQHKFGGGDGNGRYPQNLFSHESPQ